MQQQGKIPLRLPIALQSLSVILQHIEDYQCPGLVMPNEIGHLHPVQLHQLLFF